MVVVVQVGDAAVLEFGEHVEPVFGALAAVTGPQPEDVAAALTGDRERDVDRPVGDLPVAVLDVDRVDEDHRIYRVERFVGTVRRELTDRLADMFGGSAKVWDVSDPRSPVVWADLTVLGRAMYATKFASTRFTPDSRQLLISTNQAVDVWDLAHRGMATRIARFENLAEEITAVDHWPSVDGFVAVTRGYLVPLRTNLDRIFQEQCRLDGGAALSDKDWVRYFPGVERVPVC